MQMDGPSRDFSVSGWDGVFPSWLKAALTSQSKDRDHGFLKTSPILDICLLPVFLITTKQSIALSHIAGFVRRPIFIWHGVA
jgi:hypothetical protein